jgi:hypothetical protein
VAELAHSVDEALGRFTLVSGSGSPDSNTACAMTALSWVAGESWTESLPCVNRVLRSNVIAANDAGGTTADQRAALVRAGEHGILDTWWVPDQVVTWALGGDKDKPFVERVIAAVGKVAEWKQTHERPNLGGAYLRDAYLGGANLGGANLGGANLGGANLRGANLGGANLRDAYLGGANLRDAYLGGAYLRGANLGGAYLRDAYLGGAYLRGANLRDAYLGGANLRGANLGGANLRGANLGGANLRDAYLGGANLGGANLGGAKANNYTTWPEGFTPSGVNG